MYPAAPLAAGPAFLAGQDRLRGGPDADLCAPGYAFSLNGNPPVDLAGHQQMAAMFYGAFPDLRQDVEDAVADGDRVAVRFTARGTHEGPLMGVPPSGRPVAVSGIAVMRVADGRVAEVWEVFDLMGMLQQIGAIPAPA
jgi:steroid delta-isomerase-like uncharacterized protein